MGKWPTRADGQNKTVGEMTPEERREVIAAAAQRVKAQFEAPKAQAAFSRLLNEEDE